MENELLNKIDEEGVIETAGSSIITKVVIATVVVGIGVGVGLYLRKRFSKKVKDEEVVEEEDSNKKSK